MTREGIKIDGSISDMMMDNRRWDGIIIGDGRQRGMDDGWIMAEG
jgi:hypothetical protein